MTRPNVCAMWASSLVLFWFFAIGFGSEVTSHLAKAPPKEQFEGLALSVRIPIRACIKQNEAQTVALDPKAMALHLDEVGNLVPIRISEEPQESFHYVNISTSYDVSISNTCDGADLVLDISADPSASNLGSDWLDSGLGLVDGKVIGRLRGASESLSEGERFGRAVGWFLAAARFWLASDLARHLFFSVYGDDGVEVSIIGWVDEKSSSPHDALQTLNLNSIRDMISTWLGVPENKVIVKVTTRNLSDHPHVQALVLQAKKNGEPGDPNQLDGEEFLKAMAVSNDALLRIGTAAKLIRLRRREIEIYVFSGSNREETLVNGAYAQAWEEDLTILLPFSSDADRAQVLNRGLILGLAHSCAGVPFLAELITTEQYPLNYSWVANKALGNVALFEYEKSVRVVNGAWSAHHTAKRLDALGIINELRNVKLHLEQRNWVEGRDLLRSRVKDTLRRIVRMAREERKKCCTKTLSFTSMYSPLQRKKLFFKYIYAAIIAFGLVFVFFAYGYRKVGGHQTSVFEPARIFGRPHID